ncbi:MAG: DsbE family thiol:disulfide interchange protein [Pseudomonadota bacterium]
MRYFLPLAVFAVLVGFLYVGLGLDPRKLDSMLLNQPAPEFELIEVTDTSQKFTHEAFQGKVSLLNAWASWCVSCRYEHDLLVQLSQEPSINVYGLNWKDELPNAQTWLKRHGNPYLASGFDESGTVGINYGLTGTPETFIIDQNGVVRYKHIGPLTVDSIRDVVQPIIEKLQDEAV